MAPAIGLSLIFSIQCTLQHRVCLLPGAFTCFHPCSPLCRMPLAAVGYLDGTLAIYDLSTQSLRHKCQHEVQPYLLSLGLGGGLWACWPNRPNTATYFLLEISLRAQGLVPNLYFSLSLGLPQRAAAVSAQQMCLAWGLALLGTWRHHEGVGAHGGS